VGLRVKPSDIHVMKKERLCNLFSGVIVDKTHVRFFNQVFECADTASFTSGQHVTISIDFQEVVLFDDEEDGLFGGDVKFILYKGNHYHLTVSTGGNENIYIDTNDVWDTGDRVGITFAPGSIHITNTRS
jgi:spermidine/putrescine transport system ATP-binding protein